jgi:hypothetical protein
MSGAVVNSRRASSIWVPPSEPPRLRQHRCLRRRGAGGTGGHGGRWHPVNTARAETRTGTIVASTLTSKEVDDGAELGALLDQVEAPLTTLTADGAYDQDNVYATVAEHSPEAVIVVPPRATAVPSPMAETDPTQRDRHIQVIAEQGRMGWQRTSGYNARAGAEGAMSRYKRILGDTLRSHARPRRSKPGSPSPSLTECSTLDARNPSAPPDNQRTREKSVLVGLHAPQHLVQQGHFPVQRFGFAAYGHTTKSNRPNRPSAVSAIRITRRRSNSPSRRFSGSSGKYSWVVRMRPPGFWTLTW